LGQLVHTPQGPPPSVVSTVNLNEATSIVSNAGPMPTTSGYLGYW
jgi:hypothetical protein